MDGYFKEYLVQINTGFKVNNTFKFHVIKFNKSLINVMLSIYKNKLYYGLLFYFRILIKSNIFK